MKTRDSKRPCLQEWAGAGDHHQVLLPPVWTRNSSLVPAGFAAPLARRRIAGVHTSYVPFFMLYRAKYNKSCAVCGCRVPGNSPFWVPGRSTQFLARVRVGLHLLVFLNIFRDVACRRELPILRLIFTFRGWHSEKNKSVKVDCAEIKLPAAEICREGSECVRSHIGVYRDGRRRNFEDVALIPFSLKLEENTLSPLEKCRGWWCDVLKYVLNFKHLSNFTEVSTALFACPELSMGLMGFRSTLQGFDFWSFWAEFSIFVYMRSARGFSGITQTSKGWVTPSS